MKPTTAALDFFRNNKWTDELLISNGFMDEGGTPQPAILDSLRGVGWTDDKLLAEGMATEEAPPVDADQEVNRYIQLRDQKSALNDELKEKLEPLSKEMEEIESKLGGFLMSTGQESGKTNHGSFYFDTTTRFNVSDRDEFLRFLANAFVYRLMRAGCLAGNVGLDDAAPVIAEADEWSFLTKAVAADALREFSNTNQGSMPPGITATPIRSVKVRRTAAKK